jgi:hypothetical protein
MAQGDCGVRGLRERRIAVKGDRGKGGSRPGGMTAKGGSCVVTAPRCHDTVLAPAPARDMTRACYLLYCACVMTMTGAAVS